MFAWTGTQKMPFTFWRSRYAARVATSSQSTTLFKMCGSLFDYVLMMLLWESCK